MSIQPGVGYSVSNLGKVSSLSIDTIMPEAQPKQFECSIVRKGGENPEYHLRVRRGLIEFDYFKTDEYGILGDKFGVWNTDLVMGQQTNVTLCYLYAPRFNLYPENSLVIGPNFNYRPSSEFLSDGYIKLEEGENYFVFIYKITPDYHGLPPNLPGPSDTEHAAPQIAVMKAGEDFINAGDESNGSGTLVGKIYQQKFVAAKPHGRLYVDEGAGYVESGFNEEGYQWVNPQLMFDPETGMPTGQTYVSEMNGAYGHLTTYLATTINYVSTSCIRKDIAYIKWNAALKRFQIFQINYGPISIRQQPIGPIKFINQSIEIVLDGWSAGGRDACKEITDPIDGYQKSLNQLVECSTPAFINESLYQKPYENS